jgi:hypothetical protein
LVPKRDYLSLERTPRPEEVQEDPPEQIENLEHPAFIARFGRSDQVDGICGRDRGQVTEDYLDPEYWRDYFEDGYTPADAWAEDITRGS